jgi:hypothetical protein
MIPISEVLEEAAREVEPKSPRPCDCDSCDCGNSGDLRAVAWWDTATANAIAIRALAAKYEGCIVADRHPSTIVPGIDVPLYRAKEQPK